MPKVIKKEDGTDETVYTQEELDANKADADRIASSAKAAADQATADLKKAQEDLAAATAAGSGNKDFNFRQLEERVKAAEKTANDAKTDAARSVDTMTNNALDASIRGLAGEDPEMAKKMRLHFTETLKNVQTATPEDFAKKLQQAYLLAAAGEAKPGTLPGGVYGSGGAGPGAGRAGFNGGGNKSLPPIKSEVLDMGKRYFGITDDDIKKFDTFDVSSTK